MCLAPVSDTGNAWLAGHTTKVCMSWVDFIKQNEEQLSAIDSGFLQTVAAG